MNRIELAAKHFHGRGIELGVAKGDFSEAILENSDCERLYSIDRWAGDLCHDDNEYLFCVARLEKFGKRTAVFKDSFENVLDCFGDGTMDFIYIDGYAHTGQEGGETLRQWWPKLKKGGVFAGHDYDPMWPKTMEQVEIFMEENDRFFQLTENDQYASWWAMK